MLKKITNWTFGSIFRTIGRFLAYILIGLLISTLLLKKDYVKAIELSENDMINRFTQDCSYYIDSGSSIGCGWASTFRTASIDTSNTSGGGVVHFSSPQWTVPRYALPQTNGYNYSLLPYQVQFQVKIDYSSLWSFNEIYINSSAETGASYGAANSYDTGISFNFFPVFSDGESPTGAGGGLCTTNYSNNDSSSKYYTITCTVPSSAYTISDLRMTYNYNRTSTQAYPLSTTVGISTNFNFLFTGILEARQYLEGLKDNQAIIDIQTNQNETISIMQNAYNGEVNGTGENGTITDEDAMSGSCGIICKLKHLIKMFSIDNLKYLIIPTEEQMNNLFEQMQDKITSKLGILGLPITVYTRLMQIAMQYDENQQNWCIQWEGIQVPNFEEHYIIQQGQWCYSDILQNEKINNFRTICMSLIGGLILLSFIQYLFNCLHRILDVPIQDNYEYFTTEDVYGIDTNTGEVQSHQIKTRTTTRRVKD